MKTLNNPIIKQPAKSIGIMLITLVAAFSFSCKKYLDVKQSSSYALISTAADCQLILNNYQKFNTLYPSDGEAWADNYYLADTGYRTLSAEDSRVYRWTTDAQRVTANPEWLYSYQMVYSANVVLEALARIGLGGADPATVNSIKGQALFFRSNAFFNVAQLYCKQYNGSTASQDPGIPLHLISDVNEKSVRGTVQQTYDQIINDLQTAVTLLPATSTVASRPGKAAAYALLARVYLSMGDYTDAGKAANSSLGIYSSLMDYNTVSTTSGTPFTPRFNNKEVLFHSVMTAPVYSFVGSGYFITYGTMLPAIARVDTTLYKQYNDNDLRKKIFFKANAGINAGSYKFTGNYEPSSSGAYFCGIATDEVYLIRAECYARAGNTTAAMTDLNTLLRTRWIAGTYADMIAAGADDALVKILTERRKELLFRGLRWTDLRRLNLENRFQVTLKRKINGQEYTLPPNDPRYTQLIPADVIANSTMAQNPR